MEEASADLQLIWEVWKESVCIQSIQPWCLVNISPLKLISQSQCMVFSKLFATAPEFTGYSAPLQRSMNRITYLPVFPSFRKTRVIRHLNSLIAYLPQVISHKSFEKLFETIKLKVHPKDRMKPKSTSECMCIGVSWIYLQLTFEIQSKKPLSFNL